MNGPVPLTRAWPPSMPTLSTSMMATSQRGRVDPQVAEADVPVAQPGGVQRGERVDQLAADGGETRNDGCSAWFSSWASEMNRGSSSGIT